MCALDMVMKDDKFIGDKVGCCPKCGEVFTIPIELALSKTKVHEYPCKHCGQLVKIK